MSDQDSDKPALNAIAKNLDYVNLTDDVGLSPGDSKVIKNNITATQPNKRMRKKITGRGLPILPSPPPPRRPTPPPIERVQFRMPYLAKQSAANQLRNEHKANKVQEPQQQHQQQQSAKRKREDWADFEAFEASDSDDQHSRQPQGADQEQFDHPWMRHDYSIQSTAMEMFTQEITDYADYLKPTFEEHAIRTYVFKATEEFVTRLWSEAKVHVYGSFNTQLYLPGR